MLFFAFCYLIGGWLFVILFGWFSYIELSLLAFSENVRVRACSVE